MKKTVAIAAITLTMILVMAIGISAAHTSGSAGGISCDAYLNVLSTSASAETVASSTPYSIYASVMGYNSSGSVVGANSVSFTNYDSIGRKISNYTHADAYCSFSSSTPASYGSSSHSVSAVGTNPETGGPCAGATWSDSLQD